MPNGGEPLHPASAQYISAEEHSSMLPTPILQHTFTKMYTNWHKFIISLHRNLKSSRSLIANTSGVSIIHALLEIMMSNLILMHCLRRHFILNTAQFYKQNELHTMHGNYDECVWICAWLTWHRRWCSVAKRCPACPVSCAGFPHTPPSSPISDATVVCELWDGMG